MKTRRHHRRCTRGVPPTRPRQECAEPPAWGDAQPHAIQQDNVDVVVVVVGFLFLCASPPPAAIGDAIMLATIQLFGSNGNSLQKPHKIALSRKCTLCCLTQRGARENKLLVQSFQFSTLSTASFLRNQFLTSLVGVKYACYNIYCSAVFTMSRQHRFPWLLLLLCLQRLAHVTFTE